MNYRALRRRFESTANASPGDFKYSGGLPTAMYKLLQAVSRENLYTLYKNLFPFIFKKISSTKFNLIMTLYRAKGNEIFTKSMAFKTKMVFHEQCNEKFALINKWNIY